MAKRTNSGSTANNISGITYNHMGLPKTMTTGGNTLTYMYDAIGTKLRKVFGAVSNWPGMPSASRVPQTGVYFGEMNAKLLQKI